MDDESKMALNYDTFVSRLQGFYPADEVPDAWWPFTRLCAREVAARLPPDAFKWLTLVEQCEAGTITDAEMKGHHDAALAFANARLVSQSDREAMYVVTFGLNPRPNATPWYSIIDEMVDHLEAADVPRQRIMAMLREGFPDCYPASYPG